MFTVLKSKEMQGNAFRSICVKTELYNSWRGWFGIIFTLKVVLSPIL